MIPETLVALAFGAAMIRPPTRHEGWAIKEFRAMPSEFFLPTEYEFIFESASLPVSEAVGYLAETQAMAPVSWLAAEVDSYSSFVAGWDGPRSVTPDESHVEDAKRLIRLLPAGLALPTPMISPSGEIGFYWRMDDHFADVVIEGGQKASIFARNVVNGGQEAFADDVPLDVNFGVVLLEVLRKVRDCEARSQ